MVDAATRGELAAMVRDHAGDALESEEERQFLVLAEDCEELVATLHAAIRDQHLLMTARL